VYGYTNRQRWVVVGTALAAGERLVRVVQATMGGELPSYS